MNRFIIKQKLPSLNEYIGACRSNQYMGAKFKRNVEEDISYYIRLAKLHKPTKAVTINFEWHEKTKRRDADNIASAKKFILDALVKEGILENDSRKFVVGFTDTIIDDKEDYVVVELLEIVDKS